MLTFKQPVDTNSRPIAFQEKKQYTFPESGVIFDNDFDGARLNRVIQKNDSTYRVRITPENIPINNSAYYAFEVNSTSTQTLYLQFDYPKPYTHRYRPKINSGEEWVIVKKDQMDTLGGRIQLKLENHYGSLVVAAQEVQNSGQVAQWVEAQLMQRPMIDFKSIGKSNLGRPVWVMDIHEGDPKRKPIIVFLTRQHPPEVTGYMAFKAFMEELLSNTELSHG